LAKKDHAGRSRDRFFFLWLASIGHLREAPSTSVMEKEQWEKDVERLRLGNCKEDHTKGQPGWRLQEK
jgi:hypothetical protein